MTTIYLHLRNDEIEIFADVSENAFPAAATFKDVVRPGESFGGFSYDELAAIARTRGQMDADELRV